MAASTGAIRVLHVDDEPDFAEMVATFLERENGQFDVETATSADAGLDRLESTDFDCVVSDYDMPGRDGIEFLEAVRERDPDLPFILYTGHGSEAVASDAISAGVTDYLQKKAAPEQYSLLANRIEQTVSRRRAQLDYREIFEKATDGILIHDPETGKVVDANRRFCELHAYSREEVLGMHVGDFSVDEPPYTNSEAVRRIGKAVDGEPQVFEWVTETGTGERLPVEVRLKHTRIGGKDRVLALVRDVSDRRERERELDAMDTLLETFVGGLPMGVIVEGADRDIRMANDALCDLFDLDASGADLVGRDCQEAAEELQDHFADPAAFLAGIERTLAEREPVSSGRLELADGRTFERDYVPYELPGGEANIWLYRDVTTREDRRRELARYEAIVENTEDGVYLFDADGTVEFVNRRVAAVSGVDRDSIVGEHVSVFRDHDVFTEREFRTVEEGIAAIAAGETEDVRVELGPETPDGTIAIALRLTAIDAGGGDSKVIGFSRDVTERKRRERHFEALFENASVPMVYTEFADGAPVVQDVNASFERVFGYDADAARGRNLDDLLVPDDRRAAAADINERVLTGEQFTAEVQRQTADGVRDFVLHSVPLKPDQSGAHSYGIYYDVTERNEYRRELERKNDRLEKFASVVSHDLRNPLTVATGHLELAQDECECGAEGHLASVRDALDRSQALVDDLLALARHGDEVGEQSDVDLAALVADSWESVDAADARLEVASLPVVRADERRLKQLLENLLRNAVEHGGDDVTVRVGGLADGFFVADDGSGVPEGERERVFETGYTTDEDGTGFGLSIVTDIVEAHDWEIRVSESDGGGARFDVTGVDVVETGTSR
ncbi:MULTISPECIES: PAS domain S-box protein [Haloarcula]|uniref:PAS domain S-box protein n=1 Tax=Haloarcula TaxID=2237 RepID=UPI0023ED0F58|nr:PAS domain S-box protein [Halomicroarcula sp. XH51]